MSWVQVWTVIAAVAGIVGLQSFWIGRALDRVEARLDRIETLLTDHGERIARVEERQRQSA